MGNLPEIRVNRQVWIGLLALGVALWVIIQYSALIAEVFAMLFGALLINLALRPLANWLERWRIPRWVTVLVIYVLILGLLGLVGGITGSAINKEASQFILNGPHLIEEGVARLEAVPILKQLVPSLDTLTQNLSQAVQTIGGALVGAASGATHTFIAVTLVLILAFFFVSDKEIGRNVLNAWAPPKHRTQVDAVVSNASARLSRWVVAQLVIIIFFMISYGAGLLIIGVPFALIIAVIGGIMEIVPFVGGVVALILSVLAALTVRPVMVIWVIILYAVITQVEANIIQPKLYSEAVDVHPALVIVALYVGAEAAGIFGALFAIPVVVVLTAIIAELKRLPTPEEDPEPTDSS